MVNRSHFEILVAEDNPADRLLISQGFNLLSGDFSVHFVENGVEATEFLSNCSPRPDLIVLDLNLARKDGKEVLAEIKTDSELKTIPVIIFSTSSADGDVEVCYRLGANAFLTKPSDLTEFLDSIKSVGYFWLQKAALC